MAGNGLWAQAPALKRHHRWHLYLLRRLRKWLAEAALKDYGLVPEWRLGPGDLWGLQD